MLNQWIKGVTFKGVDFDHLIADGTLLECLNSALIHRCNPAIERQMTARKSGIRDKRRKAAQALVRDRKIYRLLRVKKVQSLHKHDLFKRQPEGLSVYTGELTNHTGPRLTTFPLTTIEGLPVPAWEKLSPWLKTQVLVVALSAWGMQTFTIHIHPDLEHQWVTAGIDPAAMVRDRIRREITKALGPRQEYFFVMEGWSKLTKAATRLHIHGGFFIREPGTEATAIDAIARACGHGLRGYRKVPRAVHQARYWREGARYIDYLFKSVRRPDQRIAGRRLRLSREATGAAREMWALLTEPR